MTTESQLNHLAVIMDGNRRWAKMNNKTVKEGHKAGVDSLTNIINWSIDFNIKYLTVYAFSTENWNRSQEEVSNIMSLLREYLSSNIKKFNEKGVRVRIIGIEDNVEKDILEKIRKLEKDTEKNNKLLVNMAFNYGGRREILDVIKKISNEVKIGNVNIQDINEELFKNNLYYGNIPDPDLVIRTGGEYRISNFLLWEVAYSEFYFTEVFWPEFSKELLSEIIINFKNRERRYGGTVEK